MKCDKCKDKEHDFEKARCACGCHWRDRTIYEPIQLLAAPPGLRTVYRDYKDPTIGWTRPVVFMAVCRVTIERRHIYTGQEKEPQPERNQVHGLELSDCGFEVPDPDSEQFRGYAAADWTDQDIKDAYGVDVTPRSDEVRQ